MMKNDNNENQQNPSKQTKKRRREENRLQPVQYQQKFLRNRSTVQIQL